MASSQDSQGSERPTTGKRTYRKEFSLFVDVGDNQAVKARDVITSVVNLCGPGKLFACVPRAGNMFILTFANKTVADLVSDGIEVRNKIYQCKPVRADSFDVSFMNLDPYVPDEQIVSKLRELDVAILGDIRRLFYEDTEVETGTRVCRVKVPPSFVSLPYLMKLSDGEKTGNYRVVHSHQRKVCHNCLDENHLFRDCPKFTCFRCSKQGHFRSQCKAIRCGLCKEWDCGTEHNAKKDKEPANDENDTDKTKTTDSELENECDKCETEFCTCIDDESNCNLDTVIKPTATKEPVYGDFICVDTPSKQENESEIPTMEPNTEQPQMSTGGTEPSTDANDISCYEPSPSSEQQTTETDVWQTKTRRRPAKKNQKKRLHVYEPPNEQDDTTGKNKVRVLDAENKE